VAFSNNYFNDNNNNLDSEINYEHFLEFIFKINQYPGVLFSKLQKVSRDSDAQFSWAMELDSNISLKTKVTSIGILLSLLENALMESNYEKSKVHRVLFSAGMPFRLRSK